MADNLPNHTPIISFNALFCPKCRVWLAYQFGYRFVCCSQCKSVISSTSNVQIPCSNCSNVLSGIPPNWLYIQCSRCNSLTIRPGMQDYFFSEFHQKQLPSHLRCEPPTASTVPSLPISTTLSTGLNTTTPPKISPFGSLGSLSSQQSIVPNQSLSQTKPPLFNPSVNPSLNLNSTSSLSQNPSSIFSTPSPSLSQSFSIPSLSHTQIQSQPFSTSQSQTPFSSLSQLPPSINQSPFSKLNNPVFPLK